MPLIWYIPSSTSQTLCWYLWPFPAFFQLWDVMSVGAYSNIRHSLISAPALRHPQPSIHTGGSFQVTCQTCQNPQMNGFWLQKVTIIKMDHPSISLNNMGPVILLDYAIKTGKLAVCLVSLSYSLSAFHGPTEEISTHKLRSIICRSCWFALKCFIPTAYLFPTTFFPATASQWSLQQEGKVQKTIQDGYVF